MSNTLKFGPDEPVDTKPVGVPPVYDFWSVPAGLAEAGGGETLVKTGGYVEPVRSVEDMIVAGKLLEASRQAQYDYDHRIEGGFRDDGAWTDATRARGFDLADVYVRSLELAKKYESAKKEIEAENARKAKAERDAEIDRLVAEREAERKASEPVTK